MWFSKQSLNITFITASLKHELLVCRKTLWSFCLKPKALNTFVLKTTFIKGHIQCYHLQTKSYLFTMMLVYSSKILNFCHPSSSRDQELLVCEKTLMLASTPSCGKLSAKYLQGEGCCQQGRCGGFHLIYYHPKVLVPYTSYHQQIPIQSIHPT